MSKTTATKNQAIPTIDKNVPLPPSRMKWPVAQMSVGDSIFVAGLNSSSVASRCRMAAIGRGLKMKFVSRAEGDGARVWRVA